MNAPRGTVAAIVAGHFAAAFAALGMPPFFPLILREFGGGHAEFLAGWLYVLPAVCVAVSSPWWGRLGDRYGQKALLLRAQLGLAASFLLAGFADGIGMFVLALALQGLVGGTFGASNAYLATAVSGERLSRTLTLMQGSARASLMLAPLLLGSAMGVLAPLELYRWLALLPLLAAFLVWRLPTPPRVPSTAPKATEAPPRLRGLLALQAIFVFSTVATFPYFIVFVQARLPEASTALAGLLFGLPHLVYLLAAAPLTLLLRKVPHSWVMGLALAALATSLAAQPGADTTAALVAWRVLMGLAMTAGFIGLHARVAAVSRAEQAGRTFGRLESGSKWGGVAAGVAAGIVAGAFGPQAPFYLGGAAALALLGSLCGTRWHRTRSSIKGVA